MHAYSLTGRNVRRSAAVARRWAVSYADLDINSYDYMPRLYQDHGYEVIVDPVVYRIGELFLTQGIPRKDGDYWAEKEWAQISEDIGGLVTFFDLIILHQQVPAFDYNQTFDSMSAQINTVGGEKIIQDVHVRSAAYDPIREAVVAQLQDRMANGPFVPAAVARQIPAYLAELGYQWAPDIGAIEPALPDEQDRTVARFLVGHLLFAGYAQMSGLPHVLSPRRGRLMAAAGLPIEWGIPAAEAAVWQKVGERLADAPGWRDEDLPWTPSFLPYLLQRTNKQRGGTETLLKNALDLRSKRSVERYRKIRRAALAPDEADDTVEARRALADAAASVAKDLGSDREELAYTRSFVIGAGPAAIGYVGGAAVGMLIGGPPGAFIGGLAGVVAPEVLKPATDRLWGWIIDGLPFISARKLLSRSARAEAEVGASLAESARDVWRRGYS
jgi:hypothetical protein